VHNSHQPFDIRFAQAPKQYFFRQAITNYRSYRDIGINHHPHYPPHLWLSISAAISASVMVLLTDSPIDMRSQSFFVSPSCFWIISGQRRVSQKKKIQFHPGLKDSTRP
jgi:hypothetical protein